MSETHTPESLKNAIAAQQGHAKESRPGNKLEHDTGKEISRTNRTVRQRAVRGMAELAESDVDPDGLYDLPPEKENFTGQNAAGGQNNR